MGKKINCKGCNDPADFTTYDRKDRDKKRVPRCRSCCKNTAVIVGPVEMFEDIPRSGMAHVEPALSMLDSPMRRDPYDD